MRNIEGHNAILSVFSFVKVFLYYDDKIHILNLVVVYKLNMYLKYVYMCVRLEADK